MTKARILAIVVLLASNTLVRAQADNLLDRLLFDRQPRGSVAALEPQLANDATYSVSLPAGWRRAGPATLDFGLFFGTQGDSLSVGMEQVFMNAAMLRAQLPGYSVLLPRAQLVLKSRLLAPPLGPEQVITGLLPQLAGGPRGAIQNLRVRRTFPVPAEYGYRQMLVLYQYSFEPQRDLAFASQANPALRGQRQVAMQGAALISTFPYLPGQATWTFGYLVLSAPYSIFEHNERTYARIFENFRLIEAGLAQRVKSNEEAAKLADSMSHTTHQVAHDWQDELGAGEAAGGDSQPPFMCYGTNQCPSNDYTYCCQKPGGATYLKCVPRSEDLPSPGTPPDTCRKVD